MTSGKRNYFLLSLFDFLYLFAWSSTILTSKGYSRRHKAGGEFGRA